VSDFISVPFTTDVDDVAEEAFDRIREDYPEFDPRDPQLAVLIIMALALRAAEIQTLLTMIPRAIFRWAGAYLFNVPPVDATPAVGTTTWTARADAVTGGLTIPAPFSVGFETDDGDTIVFSTVENIVFAANQTVVAGVQIVADEEGLEGNGMTGPVLTVDADDRIVNVTLQGSTAGGSDAEEDDDYLDRLSRRLTLSGPKLTRAVDFATLALEEPEVYRAIAIDNFTPPATYNAEKAAGLATIGPDGLPISATAKTRIKAKFEGLREWGFILNMFDPTYNEVDATFTITTLPGFSGAEVVARAEAALKEYLSPINWGTPNSGEARGWKVQTNVRAYELATILNNVVGVDEVTALSFQVNNGAASSADKVLTGAIPLTTVGTIVGTAA
jgi:hypothetical protein